MPTENTTTSSKPRRPSFVFWSAMGILGSLIAASSWQYWQSKQKNTPEFPVFSDESHHPNQQTVPISLQCGYCHPKEFRAWANSDHGWAHRDLTAKFDAQPFKNQSLNAHHTKLQFITSADGKRQIQDSKSKEIWNVDFAIGRRPLVQYLIKGKEGGYHTASSAWDTQKEEWFDMFGGDSRQRGEWGHWLGRGMIWNTQCAWCHMSGFDKNYDLKTHTWASTWKEPGVSCIQCHGPLLAKAEAKTGCLIDTKKKISLKQQGDNCASCHARRDEFDHKFAIGKKFEDHFQLNLPTQPHLWWANGMQRDEVYTETGLKLSRMGHAGVGCVDCHDPHSGGLRHSIANNELCLTCHGSGKRNAPIISPSAHSHHAPGTSGNRCVECHMPETLYMARDPRRDHSFNLPDPFLTKELGVPNACNMCHKDKTPDWAMDYVNQWYGPNAILTRRERTKAVHAALHNDPNALEPLLKSLQKEDIPGWRATMLELLQAWSPDPQVIAVAEKHANDADPLVRSSVAQLLSNSPHPILRKYLTDPAKNVRLRASWGLRNELPANSAAFLELLETSKFQADQPAGAMKLAQLYAGKQDPQADYWFNKAVEWDPSSSVVRRDFAVYLAGKNELNAAIAQLLEAIKIEPKNASLHYLLSLAYAENNNPEHAIKSLDVAIQNEPTFARALYNRAILIWQTKRDLNATMKDLVAASQAEPTNPEYLHALGMILMENNQFQAAKEAFRQALKRNPNFEPSLDALRQLGQ